MTGISTEWENLFGKYGDGTAYEITPEGEFTLLYSFDINGNAPYVPLFQGTEGLLYGSTNWLHQ